MAEYRTLDYTRHIKKKTMTVEEFRKEWGVGYNKAYEMVNAEDFPIIKLGRKYLIIRSKVDEWIETHIGTQF